MHDIAARGDRYVAILSAEPTKSNIVLLINHDISAGIDFVGITCAERPRNQISHISSKVDHTGVRIFGKTTRNRGEISGSDPSRRSGL